MSEILSFDSDGRPELPEYFDEFDNEFVERVDLDYERATELEAHVRDHFTTELEPQEYVDLLDAFASEMQDSLRHAGPDSDYEKDSHWASEHAYCRRQVWYKWMGMETTERNTLRDKLTFDIGSAVGAVIVEAFVRNGSYEDMEPRHEFTLSELDYPRSGRADIIINDPTNDGEPTPVEVKSMKSASFHANGKPWPGVKVVPRKSYCLQLHDQMHAHDSEYGYVFCVDKNTHEFAIHRVHWNEDLWREGIYYDRFVEWYYDERVMPPRHPNAGVEFYVEGSRDGEYAPGDPNPNESSFPCVFPGGGKCNYFSRCWAEKAMMHGNAEWAAKAEPFIDEDEEYEFGAEDE